ncbi:MAG: hypothetical protein ACK4N4_04560 [Burkholderiales bacterium]
MIIAHRKQRLFVSAALYLGEKVGEFLVGSQLRRLVGFFWEARAIFALWCASAALPTIPAFLVGATGCSCSAVGRILANRPCGASESRHNKV